jgi:hypothetical protein
MLERWYWVCGTWKKLWYDETSSRSLEINLRMRIEAWETLEKFGSDYSDPEGLVMNSVAIKQVFKILKLIWGCELRLEKHQKNSGAMLLALKNFAKTFEAIKQDLEDLKLIRGRWIGAWESWKITGTMILGLRDWKEIRLESYNWFDNENLDLRDLRKNSNAWNMVEET